MTHHTQKRSSSARSLGQVFSTSTRRDQATVAFVRTITNVALGRAKREVEARADHANDQGRAFDRRLEGQPLQQVDEKTGNA